MGIIGSTEPTGFFKGSQLSDDTVKILGIVFANPGFNAGGVKNGHGGKGRVDFLADRFGEVNKKVEHGL